MSRDFYDEEEAFHAQDRKQFRKERRLAQQSDRSQFKKSDRPSTEPQGVQRPDLPRGRVVSISGEGMWVDGEGGRLLCSLKGVLKKEKLEAKNLIAVGDFVRLEGAAIVEIEPRFSFLARSDITGNKEQLIAVNVDLAILCLSLTDPPLKPSLVDRYLIAAKKGKIHPVIVLNKIDLLPTLSTEERRLYEEFLAGYEPLGFPLLAVSAHEGRGLEALRSLLQGKVSVFAGQSGVGKSSLLNTLFGWERRTGDLAQKTSKGSHTTTVAELLPLPQGGYSVDTPGVRSFAIWKLEKGEVLSHFEEIAAVGVECRYPDCTHFKEPGCAVKEALEEKKLSSLRYDSYRTLLNEACGQLDHWSERKHASD